MTSKNGRFIEDDWKKTHQSLTVSKVKKKTDTEVPVHKNILKHI